MARSVSPARRPSAAAWPGPVRVLLRGWDSPAALLFRVDAGTHHIAFRAGSLHPASWNRTLSKSANTWSRAAVTFLNAIPGPAGFSGGRAAGDGAGNPEGL